MFVIGCAPQQQTPVRAYVISGHRPGGRAATIAVRPERWAETDHVAQGADERLLVTPSRVVRVGIYGNVDVAERPMAAAYQARTWLLTQMLPPPQVRGHDHDVYQTPGLSPLYVSRRHGEIVSANIPGFADFSGIVRSDGVIVGWRSGGDGFEGSRLAGAPSPEVFAEPPSLRYEPGDPSRAMLGTRAIKVFVDTGTSGFAVSSRLAREAVELHVSVPVRSAEGPVQEPLVRFRSFQQLGVTRRDQIARVTSSLPAGYDAVEGIGMLKGSALHFAPGHRVRADRNGCDRGLPYSSWGGAVRAQVWSTERGSFGGSTIFDTGHSGIPLQRMPASFMLAIERSRTLKRRTVNVSIHTYTAWCAPNLVTFRMQGLPNVQSPACYVPDPNAGLLFDPTRAFPAELSVEPVGFLGGATTIDTMHNLICRTSRRNLT